MGAGQSEEAGPRQPAAGSGSLAALGGGGRVWEVQGGEVELTWESNRTGMKWRGGSMACSSMPAAAWLGNERRNDVNAMERGESKL